MVVFVHFSRKLKEFKILVYSSITGNIDRFVNNFTDLKKLKLTASKEARNNKLDSKFILLTSSTGFGEPIDYVLDFMDINYQNCVGLMCSGNRNWGNTYCGAVDQISKEYNLPVLMKFELSGVAADVNKFKEIYNELFRIKLTSGST